MKITIDAISGEVEATQDGAPDENGNPTSARWNIPAGQVAQHLPMFTEAGARKASKGDLDAMRDIGADHARKVARGDA